MEGGREGERKMREREGGRGRKDERRNGRGQKQEKENRGQSD